MKRQPLIIIVGVLSWLLVASLSTQHAQATANPSTEAASLAVENACADGYYMDLSANTCRQRVKSFGFDQQRFQQSFSNREYTLSTCTEAALKELFEEIRGVGGQINLPACTITIRHSFPIPSNTILQGAGVGRTIFKAASGFSGNVVKSKYEQNIIIRDISVDGGRTANSGVLVWYANNALIERVDVYNSKNSGIVFRFAKQITIRYSESHGHQTYHGIDSKDCHPRSSTPDNQECAERAGPISPGALWSTDYAIYSNKVYNNGTHGINSHATHGEVAGNLIYDNRYGSKFPDVTYAWIHHNKFSNNNKVGSWVYATLDSSVRTVSKIVYFNNIFAGNRGYPMDLDSPAQDIYMIANQYQSNQPNRLSISNAGVYVCDNTSDKSIGYSGSPAPRTASLDKCDLSQIAHIFGHDSSVPSPPQPTSTSVPPTNTPTSPATSTSTPVPPTSTPVPPTSTPIPPTNTPTSPATSTSTPIPSTSTATATNMPTATSTNTPSNTSVPSTSTPIPPTSTPTATATQQAQPTATAQPITPSSTPPPTPPPTPSPTPSPTSLPAPSPTPTAQESRRGDAIQIPGRIEAEEYKAGGSGIGYYDTTLGNAGGAVRVDDVDIERTNDNGTDYNVGWIIQGEWLAYDIVVQHSGSYKLVARVNSWDRVPRRFHVTLNGHDVTGTLEFDSSIGHRVWMDVVKTDIRIPAGVYEMKIHMDTGGFNINYIDLDLIEQSTNGSAPSETALAVATVSLEDARPRQISDGATTRENDMAHKLFLPFALK